MNVQFLFPISCFPELQIPETQRYRYFHLFFAQQEEEIFLSEQHRAYLHIFHYKGQYLVEQLQQYMGFLLQHNYYICYMKKLKEQIGKIKMKLLK